MTAKKDLMTDKYKLLSIKYPNHSDGEYELAIQIGDMQNALKYAEVLATCSKPIDIVQRVMKPIFARGFIDSSKLTKEDFLKACTGLSVLKNKNGLNNIRHFIKQEILEKPDVMEMHWKNYPWQPPGNGGAPHTTTEEIELVSAIIRIFSDIKFRNDFLKWLHENYPNAGVTLTLLHSGGVPTSVDGKSKVPSRSKGKFMGRKRYSSARYVVRQPLVRITGTNISYDKLRDALHLYNTTRGIRKDTFEKLLDITKYTNIQVWKKQKSNTSSLYIPIKGMQAKAIAVTSIVSRTVSVPQRPKGIKAHTIQTLKVRRSGC